MTCSTVNWYSVTDVSGQPVGTIFKNQAVQENSSCPLKMGPTGCPERRYVCVLPLKWQTKIRSNKAKVLTEALYLLFDKQNGTCEAAHKRISTTDIPRSNYAVMSLPYRVKANYH